LVNASEQHAQGLQIQ